MPPNRRIHSWELPSAPSRRKHSKKGSHATSIGSSARAGVARSSPACAGTLLCGTTQPQAGAGTRLHLVGGMGPHPDTHAARSNLGPTPPAHYAAAMRGILNQTPLSQSCIFHELRIKYRPTNADGVGGGWQQGGIKIKRGYQCVSGTMR